MAIMIFIYFCLFLETEQNKHSILVEAILLAYMMVFSIIRQTVCMLTSISFFFSGYPYSTLCTRLFMNGYSYREEMVKIMPCSVH